MSLIIRRLVVRLATTKARKAVSPRRMAVSSRSQARKHAFLAKFVHAVCQKITSSEDFGFWQQQQKKKKKKRRKSWSGPDPTDPTVCAAPESVYCQVRFREDFRTGKRAFSKIVRGTSSRVPIDLPSSCLILVLLFVLQLQLTRIVSLGTSGATNPGDGNQPAPESVPHG